MMLKMSPSTLYGNHALVIGGSIAGLLSARVLSRYFARVTLIERDQFPESIASRKGVPQGQHAHGILVAGLRALERLFPGFEAELVAKGAVPTDPGRDVIWHQFNCYKLRLDTGLDGILLSRPLIETLLRRRVLALPNVTTLEQTSVRELIHDAIRGRVLGVRVTRHALDEGRTEEIMADLRRHYEKMAPFPQGYLVLGDAMCSFNPIYGQGMSVAALEAEALEATLAGCPGLDNLARCFYKKITPVVETPWTLASGADLGYAHIEGRRSLPVKLINAYIKRMHCAAAVDPVVAQAFFNVANLMKVPPALFKPNIVWRVLRAQKQARAKLPQPIERQPRADSVLAIGGK